MPSGRRRRTAIIKPLLSLLVVVTQGCGPTPLKIDSVQGTVIDFDMVLGLYLDSLSQSSLDLYRPVTSDEEASAMTRSTAISSDDGVNIDDVRVTTVAKSISYGDATRTETVKGAEIRVNAKITTRADCRTGNHRIRIQFPSLTSLRETSICPRLLIGKKGQISGETEFSTMIGALFPDGASLGAGRIEFEGDKATFPSFTVAYLSVRSKTGDKTRTVTFVLLFALMCLSGIVSFFVPEAIAAMMLAFLVLVTLVCLEMLGYFVL